MRLPFEAVKFPHLSVDGDEGNKMEAGFLLSGCRCVLVLSFPRRSSVLETQVHVQHIRLPSPNVRFQYGVLSTI